MKFFKSTFVLFIASLFVLSCSETVINTNNTTVSTPITNSSGNSSVPATTTDDLAATRVIYLKACVGCHRENGEGGAAEFEGKKIRVPSFQSKGAINSTDERLYDHIANGEENEMPAFKDKLSDAQMKNLVKFIRKEFQKK